MIELGWLNDAKAEVIVGTTTSTAAAGLSWAHDVFPIISEVAICAGAIIAVHGIYEIILKETRQWRAKKKAQKNE